MTPRRAPLAISADEQHVLELLRQLPAQFQFALHAVLHQMVTGTPLASAPLEAQRTVLNSTDFSSVVCSAEGDVKDGDDDCRSYRDYFGIPRRGASHPYRLADGVRHPKGRHYWTDEDRREARAHQRLWAHIKTHPERKEALLAQHFADQRARRGGEALTPSTFEE
jgi:hypothetical protein